MLEGSTLGGSVLYARFRERWGIEEGRGATFLYGFGAATGRLWKAFVTALDAARLHAGDEAACIAAARATFDTIERCYSEVAQPHA